MKYNLCFLFVLILLLWSGCKKDCLDPTNPECANYDPCVGYEQADADFEIIIMPLGLLGWDCDGKEPRDIEFEVDTILSGSTVHFRANQHEKEEDNITYEWKVGTDARTWTARAFELGFAENAVGDVPITLIVEKANPNSCGGTTYTVDTLTKNLHIKRRPEDIYNSGSWSSVFGEWEGHNLDDTLNTFQIEIKANWEIEGLIEGCVYRWPVISIGRTFFYVSDAAVCSDLCGLGILSDDHRELTFEYSYRADNGNRVYHTFVGEKLR